MAYSMEMNRMKKLLFEYIIIMIYGYYTRVSSIFLQDAKCSVEMAASSWRWLAAALCAGGISAARPPKPYDVCEADVQAKLD